jgi:hypothetical protein
MISPNSIGWVIVPDSYKYNQAMTASGKQVRCFPPVTNILSFIEFNLNRFGFMEHNLHKLKAYLHMHLMLLKNLLISLKELICLIPMEFYQKLVQKNIFQRNKISIFNNFKI